MDLLICRIAPLASIALSGLLVLQIELTRGGDSASELSLVVALVFVWLVLACLLCLAIILVAFVIRTLSQGDPTAVRGGVAGLLLGLLAGVGLLARAAIGAAFFGSLSVVRIEGAIIVLLFMAALGWLAAAVIALIRSGLQRA
jgi:hypothetical protein